MLHFPRKTKHMELFSGLPSLRLSRRTAWQGPPPRQNECNGKSLWGCSLETFKCHPEQPQVRWDAFYRLTPSLLTPSWLGTDWVRFTCKGYQHTHKRWGFQKLYQFFVPVPSKRGKEKMLFSTVAMKPRKKSNSSPFSMFSLKMRLKKKIEVMSISQWL